MNSARTPTGLGTFGGVFTPSLLTILGVIMYLRFGWVVGNVGLVKTLVIVTLSTGITLLTALSISAIATAQRVKVGGAYYMISRSLGIETGGAVGITLFLAQALSVALYTIGFAESVVGVFPRLDERLVGIVTLAGVTLVALKSARTAIKAQYVIMAAIAVSLVSFAFGGAVVVDPVAASRPVEAERFWVVFAVFFPAVTGIMAGVNMSGDLAKPGRSIPRGTLAAVAAGYVIYMSLPFFLHAWAPASELVADPLIMQRMAFWGDAILLGVWGATLSSAVGSILGAPRVLQALARDGVLPAQFSWLGTGSGPDDEPRNGTAITFGLALIAVILGNLNLIAPILTMFFLTTYGILNVSAGLERFLGHASYRPVLKVHWFWSLLGAVGCVAVMFLINALATTVAIVIVLLIYFWLERQELRTAWGDVRSGVWMTMAQAGLLRIRHSPDPKNWRPHILLLSGAPTRRWHLVETAAALTHNRALMTVSTILPSDVGSDRLATVENTLREFLGKRGVQCLVRAAAADTPYAGAQKLVDSYGLGRLVPNTLMLGDSESEEYRSDFCNLISHAFKIRRNTLVLRYNSDKGFGRKRRIDVWWGGLKGNGSLMMILAYLLSTSIDWRGASVRLKMVLPNASAAETARANVNRIVSSIRLGAEPEIIVANGRPFQEILEHSSRDSDLVLLGLAPPDENFVAYYESVQKRLAALPSTLLVLAAEDLAFGDVLLETETR